MTELDELGLTGYEQAAYEAVLSCGQATAKDIAKAARLAPTAVYPNLKSLAAKGLVQKIEGEPARYAAIDPSIAIPALARRRADALLDAGRMIVPKLSTLAERGLQTALPEPVSVSLGIEASHEITRVIASCATRSVFVSGWGFSSKKNMHSILSMLGDHAEAGKDVRLLVRNTQAAHLAPVRACQKRGVKVRIAPIAGLSIIVGDAKECKITLKSPELGDRINMHIKDAALSKLLHDYFCAEWKNAQRSSPSRRT